MDNSPTIGTNCACVCDAGEANGSAVGIFNGSGLGCGALNNRTCNIETDQGLIRSGRFLACRPVASTNGGQSGGPTGPAPSARWRE